MKKDFDIYYSKVCKQLLALEDTFNDLAKEVSNGMVEPERQTQMENTIQPIRDSYQTLSYIKYLLDKPAKSKKHSRYKSMNKKLLEVSKGKQAKDILKRNDDILKGLKRH